MTTSLIVEKDFEKGQILTASHSQYLIEGSGKQAIIDLDDFELLRNGFSPEQIKALNSSSPLLAH